MKELRYKVRNWRQHNRASKNGCSFTLWPNDDVRAAWLAEPMGKRGAPLMYSDLAIQCYLTMVADDGARKAHQDWSKGDQPCQVGDISAGRGGGAQRSVRGNPHEDKTTAACANMTRAGGSACFRA